MKVFRIPYKKVFSLVNNELTFPRVIQESAGENFINAVSGWCHFKKKKMYAQGSCCKKLPGGKIMF